MSKTYRPTPHDATPTQRAANDARRAARVWKNLARMTVVETARFDKHCAKNRVILLQKQ